MTVRGQGGALILGGRLLGSPLVDGALLENDTSLDLDGVGIAGVVAAGDTFTLAGEAGSPTHTVTGGPFYTVSACAISSISFTPAIAAGGVADDAAISFDDNEIAELRSWTIDDNGLDLIQDTVKGDTHRTYKGGQARFSGSASAWLDYDDPAQAALIDEIASDPPDGTLACLLFQLGTGRYLYGGAIVRNVVPGSPDTGLVPVGFTFIGTGQMLTAWAGAYDNATGSDGVPMGVYPASASPTYVSPLGFGGWIVDRVDSGVDNGAEIMGNRFEIVGGIGAGQGGQISKNGVIADGFDYFWDFWPASSTTNMGLVFRASENDDVDYWERQQDGFELYMQSAGGGLVDIVLFRRVAGTATQVVLPGSGYVAEDQNIPMRLGVTVSGSLATAWREPVGGGARTNLFANMDLTTLAGGSSDDFNDVDHIRFGVKRGSTPDIGSQFDNGTVLLVSA